MSSIIPGLEAAGTPFSTTGGGLVGILVYLFLSYGLYAIAKKTNTNRGWFAFIPILNLYLILKIAKRPGWWLIFFLIPFLNIIIWVVAFMDIAKVVNKPDWLGILMVIPFLNIIVLFYLAFSEKLQHS